LIVALVAGMAAAKPKSPPSMKALLKEKDMELINRGLQQVGKIAQKAIPFIRQQRADYLTVECALCGIAINEIQGMLVENQTMQNIENFLKSDVCSWMSTFGPMCDDLVNKLPSIANELEHQYTVSAVCIELNYCKHPFIPYKDPEPVPTYTINLDLAPSARFAKVCVNPVYQAVAQFLVDTVNSILPDHGSTLELIGDVLNDYYYPYEFAQEIAGCSSFLGIPTGWATLFNLGYEVSDACTSIVAATPDGTVIHGRNLDFWAGMGFTDSLKNMTYIANFVKGGKTVFQATTFAAFSGVLSGIRPNGFSVTINTRFYPQGLGDMFYEIIAAIEEKNASLVSFLTRETLEHVSTYDAALYDLSNDELIADVFYTVAGSQTNQGAVISRNRINATNVWKLAPPSQWYLVQTNYDHWTQPPWFDDRVVPAENALKAITQKGITMTGMFSVLSVKPVLNLQTTYTIIGIPKNGTWNSWTRWCPFPCVE